MIYSGMIDDDVSELRSERNSKKKKKKWGTIGQKIVSVPVSNLYRLIPHYRSFVESFISNILFTEDNIIWKSGSMRKAAIIYFRSL